jgi:hypothetical protein
MDFVTSLEVNGETFALTARDGRVDVRYAAVDDPDVTIKTEYEPMVAAGDGRLPLGEFTANHLHITAHTPDKVADMLARRIHRQSPAHHRPYAGQSRRHADPARRRDDADRRRRLKPALMAHSNLRSVE